MEVNDWMRLGESLVRGEAWLMRLSARVAPTTVRRKSDRVASLSGSGKLLHPGAGRPSIFFHYQTEAAPPFAVFEGWAFVPMTADDFSKGHPNSLCAPENYYCKGPWCVQCVQPCKDGGARAGPPFVFRDMRGDFAPRIRGKNN
jgi:hypothetical protein